MKKATGLIATFFLLFFLTAASAFAQTISWKQIVGIIPAGNVIGSGTGMIAGGFLPWSTTSGTAHVNLRTGEIEFVVRGLVFAGGSSTITIGSALPVTAVKGTLICDNNGSASGGNSILVETPSVPLTESGNARFSGNLGTLPAVCASEPDIAFVIRASAFNGAAVNGGPWIANGAVILRNNGERDENKDR